MTRGPIHKMMGLVVLLSMVGGAGILIAAGIQAQPAEELEDPFFGAMHPPTSRFVAFDVFVDAGDDGLAAWQIEYEGTNELGPVLLVGIEGGEHAAYATPAFYDPEALAGGRVILAAYSVSDELPSGPTRVARLHLQAPFTDVASAQLGIDHVVTLMAAGNASGDRLTGRAWVEPMKTVTQTNPNETTDEETDSKLGGETNSTGDDT